ncbi:hypothetical protein [Sorangium sp. So ce1099]|uniref:hypothetical protein n=1 Tax=Sorangium sp. So ce1099 TaxID=3133331 RepID=UPI003F5F693B
MSHRIGSFFPSLLMLGLAAAACDSQVDPGYEGEPLVQVQGRVSADAPTPASGMKAVLIWIRSISSSPDQAFGESAAVTGEFPATFTMDIYTAPPDEALNDWTPAGPDETRVGLALMVAIPANFELTEDVWNGDAPLPPVMGVAERHVLAYVERDIVPGSSSEASVGGALPAGFHVLEELDSDDPACDDRPRCLRPTPDDLDTLIEVRVAETDTLRFPDLK